MPVEDVGIEAALDVEGKGIFSLLQKHKWGTPFLVLKPCWILLTKVKSNDIELYR